MSATERKINDLLDDDPDMEEAIAAVARVADEEGEVEWGDVKGEITSGQWGRIIQQGIVVDNENGAFELSDPDAVESALSDDATAAAEISADLDEVTDMDDVETEGWSTYDKAAGVGVLLVMVGYYYNPVQRVVGGTIDALLGPVDAVLPFYVVILVLAMLTGVYSTLLQANLMNTEVIGAYQEQASALNERRKKAKERGDEEELDRIQEQQMEMMGDQLGMFKEQFRPMVWITLITIPVFLWMYWKVQNGLIAEAETSIVMPLLGEVEWQQGVLGPMQAWIIWYFLCSMGFTQLIRKALNIQTTPTG
ncbi:HTR-like protein [Halobacteriales archaeon QS_8_69_26]|nr:MAG: HTR-like protein [Halobacteriales archaeon QS_8_69_26]